MTERTPVDPFAALNIDQFKKPASEAPVPVSKRVIAEAAQQSQFQSRQVAPPKEMHLTKTYSLHPSDVKIIKSALSAYENVNPTGYVSGSDVVRAALHAFAELPEADRTQRIEKHRAKGKKT